MPFRHFGSVSAATMRPEDLLPAFHDTLKALGGKVRTKYGQLANLDRLTRKYWDSEDPGWDLESLETALNELCPPYVCFGAHPGDGADFGFWVSWDSLDEAVRSGEVLKVPAGDPWPDLDDAEYVLEVNDHGNATLYTPTREELWSIV